LKPEQNILIKKSLEAREMAYSPFSGIKVGAALLSDTGKIFTGCNVESSSFSLTICAERTALVKAISEGENCFKAIAIASSLDDYTYPCGACRQFLIEFSSDLDVIIVKNEKDFIVKKLNELLPCSFTLKEKLKDHE
jgi:cytidine deaminase